MSQLSTAQDQEDYNDDGFEFCSVCASERVETVKCSQCDGEWGNDCAECCGEGTVMMCRDCAKETV